MPQRLPKLAVSITFIAHSIQAFQPFYSFPVAAKKARSSWRSSLESLPGPFDTLTSGLASICRLPKGVTASSISLDDVTLRVLYDVETSADCRQVRERITELDLTVQAVVPSAPNSRVFQNADMPFHLKDPSTPIPSLIVGGATTEEDRMLSGSQEILEYLNQIALSTSQQESSALSKYFDTITGTLASILRTGRGTVVSSAAIRPDTPRPEKPLVLYSYEGNQFCRLVREVLTELDIVYELRNAGKESPRRMELAEMTGGSSQCPYLMDPNTGESMFESKDIIGYLYKTYANWVPPNVLLRWASDRVLPLARPVFVATAPIFAGSRQEDGNYAGKIEAAKARIGKQVNDHAVVIYTYDLSPFSSETKSLLDNLQVKYHEISLGAEWIPGMIQPEGSIVRAALLEMTGQSSLPHVFIGGKTIGGLFSGTPGLIPALEEGSLLDRIERATMNQVTTFTE